jgi:hypothetical protein
VEPPILALLRGRGPPGRGQRHTVALGTLEPCLSPTTACPRPVCLALLLVLTAVGADPWDGLTVVPWFAFPVAFLLFCAVLVRSLLRRRRA